MSSEEFEELKEIRTRVIPRADDITIDLGNILLIYIKDKNTIIAEYDIVDYQRMGTEVRLNVEPIYHAPNGTKMKELVLLTLTSYDIDGWRQQLDSGLTPITQRDFEELTQRLKH